MRHAVVFISVLMAGVAPATLAFASSTVPPAAQAERMAAPSPLTPQAPGTQSPEDLTSAVPLLPRPAGAESMRVTLSSIAISGNSALSQADLAPYTQGLTGTPIALSQLYEACDALTRHYRAAGYVLARASLPPQELGKGSAQITIDEGKIASINYEGPGADSALVRKTLRKLEGLSVFHLPSAERALLLLDDQPGMSYRLVLQPAPNGGVALTVLGEREQRIQTALQFDNSGSRYLGPYLAGGSLLISNLFGLNSQTTLSLSSALQLEELTSISLLHTQGLWRPELQLSAELQATRGEPGYTLSSNDIDSRSWQADVHLDYTWLRQRSYAVVLTGGLQVREATTDLLGSRLSHDEGRSAYIAGRAAWSERNGASSLVRLELAQGLGSWLGGSEAGDADLSRSAADTSYTKLDLTLLRMQPLGQHVTFFGAVRGQLADAPLLAGDEFGYGGHFIGRAYDTSEMVGDSGLSLLGELRLNPLQVNKLSLQPFVFADYGALWNRDNAQLTRDEGASAGLGLEATYKATQARVLLAKPLQESRASTYPNNPGPRLLFSLQSRF